MAKQTGVQQKIKTKTIHARNSIRAIGYDLVVRLHKTLRCNCLWASGVAPVTDRPTITKILDYLKSNDPDLTPESVQSVRLTGHNNPCWPVSFGWDEPFDPPGLIVPTVFLFELSYKADIPIFELVWEEDCKELEALLGQGKCEISSSLCLDASPTKSVEGVPLTSDCWKKEVTYRCHTDPLDNCKALLEKGCVQISSRCKTKDGGECIEWEQTFECHETPHRLGKTRLKGDTPFCLDGDCVDQSWAPNQDMADSLSKLAIFKEMQKDMDFETHTVFKGSDLRCSRIPASFKNCCAQKGWGMKVGMAGCSDNEKKLAQQRKLNKCVMVGTYCAEKEFGICTKKKTTFCCYQTKLSRIINEQGRRQLGMGVGDPENPQCHGLTLTQFSQLDFSKIDFSELFQDLVSKIQLPNTQKITQGIQHSMTDQSRLMTDRAKKITQGRPHGDF